MNIRNLIQLVLAVLLISKSIIAYSLSPTQITDARTISSLVSVDISGASSVRHPMFRLLQGLCRANTISYYRDIDGLNLGHRFSGLACESSEYLLDAIALNTPVFFSMQFSSSEEGVIPIARAEAVEFMNVEAGNCTINIEDTSADPGVTYYDCNLNQRSPNALANSIYFCDSIPGDTSSHVEDRIGFTSGIDNRQDLYTAHHTRCTIPMAGISNHEPSLYGFSEISTAPLRSGEIHLLNSATVFAQPFVPVVSNTFAAVLDHHRQYRGIAHPVLPWAFVRNALGAINQPLIIVPHKPPLPGNLDGFGRLSDEAENLVLCRNTHGSGALIAQSLHYAMTDFCEAKNFFPLMPGEAVMNINALMFSSFNASNGHRITIEGQSARDIKKCLSMAEDGTLAGQVLNDPGVKLSALGYMSLSEAMDGDLHEDRDANYQYVAVNGMPPRIEYFADASNENFWEATMQWCGHNDCLQPPPPVSQVVLQSIRSLFGNTHYIAFSDAGEWVLGTSGPDVGNLGEDMFALRASRLRFGDSCRELSTNP